MQQIFWFMSRKNNNKKAKILAETLDEATDMFLDNKKDPTLM